MPVVGLVGRMGVGVRVIGNAEREGLMGRECAMSEGS